MCSCDFAILGDTVRTRRRRWRVYSFPLMAARPSSSVAGSRCVSSEYWNATCTAHVADGKNARWGGSFDYIVGTHMRTHTNANTNGAAAAACDVEMHATYVRRADTAMTSCRFAIATQGRLGRPARDVLRTLDRRSADAGGGRFTPQQIVDDMLREISTALCRSNVAIEHTVASAFSLPPGRALNCAEACPSVDGADRDQRATVWWTAEVL